LYFGAHFDYVLGSFLVVDSIRGFVVVDKVEGIVGSIANLGDSENYLSC